MDLVPECVYCDGLGWVLDPSACADPEHCEQMVPCRCNPEGLDI